VTDMLGTSQILIFTVPGVTFGMLDYTDIALQTRTHASKRPLRSGTQQT
jgi:hypothetical protein